MQTTPNVVETYSASWEKPCVMSVRGLNNVGRAVQTDTTLLRYASAITEQKKCWELLAEKFDWFQTLHNNTKQHPTTCNRVCKRTQHVTSNNVGSCWSTMLRPFAGSLGIHMYFLHELLMTICTSFKIATMLSAWKAVLYLMGKLRPLQ